MNIDEIKERLAKATSGPWGQMGGSLTIYKHQGGGAYWVASVFDSELPEQTANADLITHAPIDIADLIKAVEAGIKKQHEIWDALKQQTKELARAYDKIKALKASK